MTEQPKITINKKHWAGRDDMKDYIHVSDPDFDRLITRHVPTGLEMARSSADRFQVDGGSEFQPFDFGLNLMKPVWAETLIVLREINGDSGAVTRIRKELGLQSISAAHEALRQRLGCTLTVTAVRPFEPHASVPWSAEIIQVLLNMVLIKLDSMDYKDGLPPKPDRAVFAPPTVPKQFHATLTNFVPEPRT